MRSREEILTDAKVIYDFLADVPPAPEKADIILAAGSHDLRGAEHAAKLFFERGGSADYLLGRLWKDDGGHV